ncbi:MAG: histidinol dehydrogenase [Pseudomonadales bacterium]|nr:histidinol dehydrogenase [Pseudomonadales bacterium]
MSLINWLDTRADSFNADFTRLLEIQQENQNDVREVVRDIIQRVRTEGDTAVVALSRQFDRLNASSVAELEIGSGRMAQAVETLRPEVRDALEQSIARVRAYHEAQKQQCGQAAEWSYQDEHGNTLGQLVRGMERVGIYAPGGKAAYPSTIIMTAVPARVAGVEELILVVPTPDGQINEVLLAAASLCGVDRMFTIGGAQAVAALAYGTETIPRVDKIVGPGNVYVAMAKELVFGDVGIDMIAGPSEVVIVADESADPQWLVMDLFAQAEHDELAQSILVSTSAGLLEQVDRLISEKVPQMRRTSIISQSLGSRGALILADSDEECAQIVNRIAPEHLELALADPAAFMPRVRHAGAIFLGHHSAEVVGDYSAGPSHVLPTSGTARFASPLGVYDFQVRTSVIHCSPAGAVALSRDAAVLAWEEGLEAHALSAEFRTTG